MGEPSKRRKTNHENPSPGRSEGIINLGMAEEPGNKVFNDSVHGHISLHPLLVKVIDTPQFQRLRNLKQLGVAYYVYPAAGHCRFEHSIGTCYLAGQLVKVLFQREKEARKEEEIRKLTLCVQLAALCHDLGHGPFSHTWEEVVEKCKQPDDPDWKHEKSSIEMLDHLIKENNLKPLLEDYLIRDEEIIFVKDLISGQIPPNKKKNGFLYEIVSNSKSGIDVDKWDYFLRDGQQLNLRISFDYKRILELCAVVETEDGKSTTIAFQEKTIMNLYDMYRVRSDLHFTAYRHKVVVNIEHMLIDAFVLAGKAGFMLNDGSSLIKEAHKDPKHLCQLTDHIFYNILYSKDKKFEKAREILERIHTRKLYTLVNIVNMQVPKGTEKGERKKYVREQVKKLKDQLGEDYRVSEFYLDLDQEKDPIENVAFYRKLKNGKLEKTKNTFNESREAIAPLPFQLVGKAQFQLLVFYTKDKQSIRPEERNEITKRVDQMIIKNGWKTGD